MVEEVGTVDLASKSKKENEKKKRKKKIRVQMKEGERGGGRRQRGISQSHGKRKLFLA